MTDRTTRTLLRSALPGGAGQPPTGSAGCDRRSRPSAPGADPLTGHPSAPACRPADGGLLPFRRRPASRNPAASRGRRYRPGHAVPLTPVPERTAARRPAPRPAGRGLGRAVRAGAATTRSTRCCSSTPACPTRRSPRCSPSGRSPRSSPRCPPGALADRWSRRGVARPAPASCRRPRFVVWTAAPAVWAVRRRLRRSGASAARWCSGAERGAGLRRARRRRRRGRVRPGQRLDDRRRAARAGADRVRGQRAVRRRRLRAGRLGQRRASAWPRRALALRFPEAAAGRRTATRTAGHAARRACAEALRTPGAAAGRCSPSRWSAAWTRSRSTSRSSPPTGACRRRRSRSPSWRSRSPGAPAPRSAAGPSGCPTARLPALLASRRAAAARWPRCCAGRRALAAVAVFYGLYLAVLVVGRGPAAGPDRRRRTGRRSPRSPGWASSWPSLLVFAAWALGGLGRGGRRWCSPSSRWSRSGLRVTAAGVPASPRPTRSPSPSPSPRSVDADAEVDEDEDETTAEATAETDGRRR